MKHPQLHRFMSIFGRYLFNAVLICIGICCGDSDNSTIVRVIGFILETIGWVMVIKKYEECYDLRQERKDNEEQFRIRINVMNNIIDNYKKFINENESDLVGRVENCEAEELKGKTNG